MQVILMKILGRLLALVGGLVWGFFVAFNAVFTDVFGAEVYGALAYVLLAYTGLGLAFGLVGRHRAAWWTGWLAAPGLLMVILTVVLDTGGFIYAAGVIVAMVAGALLGSMTGATLSRWWFSRGAQSRDIA